MTLLAFFDEKDVSEQLFAGFSTNQEKISESAKLLIWLNAFSSTVSQWDSDPFEDVLIRLRDLSLLQTFARGLDGFCHASLHPLMKDWIRLRTNESTSQKKNIYGSNACEKNSGKCLAKTALCLAIIHQTEHHVTHYSTGGKLSRILYLTTIHTLKPKDF